MRVLIFDKCYLAFLESRYGSHPGLADASYTEQEQALMDTHFATADAYSHNLAKIGIEAHEIVVGGAAWAREHDIEPDRDALGSLLLTHRGRTWPSSSSPVARSKRTAAWTTWSRKHSTTSPLMTSDG